MSIEQSRNSKMLLKLGLAASNWGECGSIEIPANVAVFIHSITLFNKVGGSASKGTRFKITAQSASGNILNEFYVSENNPTINFPVPLMYSGREYQIVISVYNEEVDAQGFVGNIVYNYKQVDH